MSNAGLPSALNGRIVHSIDFQPAVECYRMEVSADIPLTTRFGFAGPIGTSVGQGPIQIRLTFAGVAEKSQFNFLARAAQQQSGGLGFSYDFWEGNQGISNHWLVTGCFLGSFGLSNDPQAGTTDKTITIQGTAYRQLQ